MGSKGLVGEVMSVNIAICVMRRKLSGGRRLANTFSSTILIPHPAKLYRSPRAMKLSRQQVRDQVQHVYRKRRKDLLMSAASLRFRGSVGFLRSFGTLSFTLAATGQISVCLKSVRASGE